MIRPKIITYKSPDWKWLWVAYYDFRSPYGGRNRPQLMPHPVVFGKNREQAIKRLKSQTFKKWYSKTSKAYLYHPTYMRVGNMQQWKKLFRTTQGDPNWDPMLGRYWR